MATDLLPEAPPVSLRTIFRRFWPETRPYRGRLWLGLVLVAVGPLLSAATIYLLKILIDDVLQPHDFHLFPLVAGAYLGLTLVGGIVAFFDEYLAAWVGERFILNLRSRIFGHLHRQSSTFFDRNELGDVLSRLTGDIAAIEQLILSGVGSGLSYVFELVFFVAALFYLDWRLALAALIAAPGFLFVARSFSSRIKVASGEKRRKTGSITSVAEESFSNAALVRAYDRWDEEQARFDTENLASFRAQMRATRLQAMFTPLTDLLEVIGVLLVVGFAVWELANGNVTLGGVLAFVAYLTQLYGPIQALGDLANELFSASAGAERVIELLDLTPAVVEPADPLPLARAHGALQVHNLSFRYEDADHPALSEIDFSVEPGQRIALVGPSGAGKSTLAKLLLRFSDPDTGSISLDGHDLRELALADLRRNIAPVLQETLVFDGTIRDNILWGRPGATEDELVRAAAAADAHSFITQLPDGYDTRVGQRGRLLSGGQRQRVAIARAMIRDAPVLLLDEPTTGLDAESTQRILAPLRRLMAGRTTIIISHNLLTVTDADRILYLEDGRIAAAGTHTELLSASPGYARLYHLQGTTPALAEIEPATEPVPTVLALDPR
ncbi:ABC transporter ATP-binding protein [Pseudonocardia xinjiangensis]|uniref:ABC transporter ATP-binding protein n=1 Tax=Pseudonocardia xinjiangensis TaxID=75289 RepID=A0ABX1RBY5_9PSEU|nr:ABC transporter ATP-binding protein [Pseudonocardia xinjiangensis]NMH77893.1 ABC transporter ATP-binding protein [Pseudonocardia xinjiangensis]